MIDYTRNNINADSERYPSELSIFNGVVRTVNDTAPDDTGNVEVVTGSLANTKSGNILLTIGEDSATIAKETFVTTVEERLRDGYTTDATVQDHLRLNASTGDILSGGWAYTMLDKLEVAPNETYKVVYERTDSQNVICEYDKNGAFIKSLTGGSSQTFTTTADTHFIRVCFASSNFAHTARVYHVVDRDENIIFVPTLGEYKQGLKDKQDKLTAVPPIVIDSNNNIKYQA